MKRIYALALVVCAGNTYAEFKDGNRLLRDLRGDTMDYVHALGYVTGVYDALQHVIHCPPQGVTAGQVGDMVKNFLEENPALRHQSADRHVVAVLRRAWPCADQRRGNNL